MTTRKIEANRTNATHSTGPRSERGKNASRFNAVTLGLFARHVPIPVCDGEMAEQDFALLLNGLHREFQPVGFYEEWLVVKIAESMWRLRRATRCESGSVRESAIWEGHRDNDQLIAGLASKVWVLEDAEKQLRESGKLSQKTYAEIAPLLEEQKNIQSVQGNEPVVAEIDSEMFLTCIMARKELLDSISPLRRANAQTDRLGDAKTAGKAGKTAKSRTVSLGPGSPDPNGLSLQNEANKFSVISESNEAVDGRSRCRE